MRNERRTPGSARGIRKPLGFAPRGRRMPTLCKNEQAECVSIRIERRSRNRLQAAFGQFLSSSSNESIVISHQC